MGTPGGTSGLLPAIHGPSEFAEAFGVSRETIGRLELYTRLLGQWQKAHNLVSAKTLDAVWHRHFADSAQLVRYAPEAKRWVDLGSGAGFPGLVVAILLQDTGGRVQLVESDLKKCAFLREVGRQTGIVVDIVDTRIESFSTQARISEAEIDVISARALAPLDRLLELSSALFSRNTLGLFLKGRDFRAELDEAERHWAFESSVAPSLTDASGRIVQVRALRARTED
jgi:16S rRNA (guanine527-N7)-methyltransferase